MNTTTNEPGDTGEKSTDTSQPRALFDISAAANKKATEALAECDAQLRAAMEKIAAVWADNSEPGQAAGAVVTALQLQFKKAVFSTTQLLTVEYMLRGLTRLTGGWDELPGRLEKQDALLRSHRQILEAYEQGCDRITASLSTSLIEARRGFAVWEAEHKNLAAEYATRGHDIISL
jgi:hypothetical protein